MSEVWFADLLDTSVAAVNSALQRARATLAAANPAAAVSRPLNPGEQLVLDAFMRAWKACDIPPSPPCSETTPR